MRLRKRPFAIEQLERRDLFAAFAVPWPEVDSLRVSFVPDGTQVGDSRSELFQMLDKQMPGVDWQLEMLAALQTWAIETDANVILVEDQGQPIGTIGFKQGDLRFGDVRLGAFPMAKDVLAVANPYDPFIANTWVGDVFLNSASNFLQDAADQAQSLLSVMTHESGHVFGIGHSTDTASPMYPYFQKPTTKLTPQDVANLRSMYGSREPDRWESVSGNETRETATEVTLTDTSGNRLAAELSADISSLADIDTYAFTVPAGTTSLHLELNAGDKSLLTSRLTVFNQQGELVSGVFASDPRSNDLELTIPSVHSGERYYVQVSSADQNLFGIGAYELELSPQASGDTTDPAKSVFDLLDMPRLAPEELMVTTPGYVEHTYYELAGALNSQTPSQRFRFHSPKLDDPLTNVFTIILNAETGDISNLGVAITDTDGNAVPMSMISDADGKWEIQVSGAKSDVDYLATIYAKNVDQLDQIYELEVDFAHDGRQLQTLVSESLSDSQPVYTQSLAINESGHYHFVVSGSDWSQPHESGVTMRILDAGGHVVATADVADGSSQWLDLVLNQGRYTIEFTSPGRLADSSVLIQLAMQVESSPIGPQLRDMSSRPVDRVAAPPIDALLTHWLPGYRGTDDAAGSRVQVAARVTTADASAISPSGLRFVDPVRDADLVGDQSPKIERAKPKKSNLKPSPLLDQQSHQAPATKQSTAHTPPASQAAIGNEIVTDATIQLASYKEIVAVQDDALNSLFAQDSPQDALGSERSTGEGHWFSMPMLASGLLAGIALASFIHYSGASPLNSLVLKRSGVAGDRCGHGRRPT